MLRHDFFRLSSSRFKASSNATVPLDTVKALLILKLVNFFKNKIFFAFDEIN